jgi:microcystin-dependent protein
MRPSLAVNYQIAVEGIYPRQFSGSSSNPFIANVSLFTGNCAAGGYMLAQGQSLAIS